MQDETTAPGASLFGGGSRYRCAVLDILLHSRRFANGGCCFEDRARLVDRVEAPRSKARYVGLECFSTPGLRFTRQQKAALDGKEKYVQST